MNDLPVSVTGVGIKTYADDTSLFRAFKTISDLQEKLIPALIEYVNGSNVTNLVQMLLKPSL